MSNSRGLDSRALILGHLRSIKGSARSTRRTMRVLTSALTTLNNEFAEKRDGSLMEEAETVFGIRLLLSEAIEEMGDILDLAEDMEAKGLGSMLALAEGMAEAKEAECSKTS